ncbi:hypothetical protein SCAR479_10416 [Seiridium cardinale]|uniref:Uncharacterized protein n=1 Tax=Seiridium cardinale TaxID=138064 RepID=A0ABR2XGH7_9PEZI
MAVSGTVQALIAAFLFGILLNTASAGFILYIKGHGSAIFRDGLRLALIFFLASSALWAQVEFLATLIDPTATSTCQAAVIISSLLDQVARVSIEQFLIWSVAKDGLKTAAGLATQVLLLVRFIIGMVFVGETKPQFNTTCVPMSNLVPIAIAVVALDAVILTSTAVLTFTTASTKSGQGSKAILLTIAALAVWMGTSVAMLLGLSNIDMFFRTTLPAIGLFILTALVTVLSGSLAMSGARRPRRPESPTPQNMNRDLDLSTSDSNEYPPSRYEEIKGMGGMVVTPFNGPEGPQRDNRAGLPVLTRPVTGVVGMGGVPVQGQLFPPLRSNTVDQASLSQNEIKTRIDLPKRSKTGPSHKIGTGKLAISAPIPMNDPEAQNAFNKIPTVDLATAARNEQERREGHARRVSALIANRPAPKPPTMSTEEAMKRATSTKRKEVVREPSVEIERSDSTKTSQTGGLSVEGNASSTSAQLSPGNEELRRRSPRQAIPSTLPAKTPTFQPVTPGQPIRIPIPRAQPSPQPVPAKVPEPQKTPLQRRPTIGLPANPRAQAMKKMTEDTGNGHPQTVMFINKITYDDPSYVNDIIQGATKTPFSPLQSSNSVVHRPRPIPRKGDKDRQVFPAEVSTQGHRRTKSGGSIMSRRSILQSQPGSPTQLPPLPPPPQSAGDIQRPQPNDTKSMTFDEKMSMFYAGPPSASSTGSTTNVAIRKSSVPSLPPLPPKFLPTVNSPPAEKLSQFDTERRLTRTTATDRTSIRTQSILGVDDIDDKYLQNADQNAADELGNSWLPGIPQNDDAFNRQQYDGNKRQSSPVIPALRYSGVSGTSDDGKTHDDAATNWGSVHSPVMPVSVSASRLNARSTWIQKDARLESFLSGFGDEVMTVMLDTSSAQSTNNRQSFLVDDDDSISDAPNIEKHGSGQWHHRVGDECPTFSTRKERVKSRKMPPPTPLLLRTASNKKAIVVHTAEPSPVESPSAAYNMIQAQLQKLEEPSRDSVASEGRRMALLEDLELEMGQQENRWQTMQYNLDRDSISTMQTESRPVSIATPASKSVTRSSSTSSILAERRASRRARITGNRSKEDLVAPELPVRNSERSIASLFQTRLAAAQMEYTDHLPDMIQKRNNLNFFSVSKAALGSPTPPDTDESDSETFPEFQSLNAKVYEPVKEVSRLWQPNLPKAEMAEGLLWEAPVPEATPVEVVELPGLSVRPVVRKSSEPLTIYSTRLWQRAPQSAKAPADSSLWGETSPAKLLGLREPQKSQKARPLTQRPPRRSKRVTLLPDILESPEPLPDNRGTLGIFQFPWGERSENATVQPRQTQTFMAMPGTMTSGRPRVSAALEARSKQLEAEEYSSSFFDDYDEEEDVGDNFDEDFYDSGDDFDENTLWEIASLLKTDVPSKNSLLPPEFSPSVIDDYIAEGPSEDEVEPEYDDAFNVVPEEPASAASPLFMRRQDEVIRTFLWTADAKDVLSRQSFGLSQPEDNVWQSYIPSEMEGPRLRTQVVDLPRLESTHLWMPKSLQVMLKPSLWIAISKTNAASQSFGLPQPDMAVWEGYLPRDEESVRSKARIEEDVKIESSSLWQPTVESMERRDSLLWAARMPVLQIPLNASGPRSSPSTQQRRNFMWEKPIPLPETGPAGLFNVKVTRADYRRTSEAPIAASMITKPRMSREPLQMLTTQKLWRSTPKLVTHKAGKRQTLWSQTSVRVAGTTTLFQLDPKRKNYRTTEAEPAAINMPTKQRKSNAPLPQISSSQFWTLSSMKKAEVNWIKISSSKRGSSKPVASTQCLFRVDPKRKDWRTTSAEPAALDMMTKSRTVNAPVPQLESTRLWSPTAAVVAEFDWITISSVRPRSPSIASIASTSSTPMSPVTDTSSIRTTSTKASTVAPSVPSMFSLRGLFERRKKAEPPVPSIPKDVELPRIPEGPSEPFIVKDLDKIPRTEPTYVPLRQQHRPNIAYNIDWDAALQEAIAASYPNTRFALVHASQSQWDQALQEAIKASHISPKIVRRAASPREWSTALNQAIAASYPQNRFSRGQTLPPQRDEELCEKIARSQRTIYDVSKLHPVFFGSMPTTTANVHPAMFGMTTKSETSSNAAAQQPLLWSKSVSLSSHISGAMWSPCTPVARPEASSLPEVQSISVRKPTPRAATKLSVESGFAGHNLWKRRDVRVRERDWLDDTMKKRFSRVELRY